VGRGKHATPPRLDVVTALGVLALWERFGVRLCWRHCTDAIGGACGAGLVLATIEALNGLTKSGHFSQ
jgi:hypothetical protein